MPLSRQSAMPMDIISWRSGRRAAIDWSWDLLTPWEQAALAQCAIFEGGFTLDAAENVLDRAPWPAAPATLDAVQALVDKSLLRTWVPTAQGRYFGLTHSLPRST